MALGGLIFVNIEEPRLAWVGADAILEL